MAKVKPFRGVRPPKEFVTEVASRPYDVLNGEEARSEAEGNPKSLYHIIKPEIDFEPGKDEHAPEVYERAVENFNAFQRESLHILVRLRVGPAGLTLPAYRAGIPSHLHPWSQKPNLHTFGPRQQMDSLPSPASGFSLRDRSLTC